MRHLPSLLTLLLCFASFNGFSQKAKPVVAVAPTKVQVYTTADSTDLRITLNATLELAPFGQPLETQPCVFVDPGKTFQTFIGIGGAITDASAETYSKLPKEKQQEILIPSLMAT